MQNLLIKINNHNGVQVTSSRNIADNLGKRHSHVVESIEKLLSDSRILENQDIGSLIIPTFYKVNGQKRKYKEYLLTKDGFILYMFNIQGYNDLKLAYINEFNRMKTLLNNPQPVKRLYWNNQPFYLVDFFFYKKLLTFCTYQDIMIVRAKGVGEMTQKSGRPKSEKTKNKRLEIRLNEEELNLINYCSVRLNLTKTDTILLGISKVKEELDKK